ncbi:MAG: hypothetical protein IT379_07135, partial [Deltaproteobacteria bacterium]|nr:hypothetical protein [Deltaproteobacteria bacterium]
MCGDRSRWMLVLAIAIAACGDDDSGGTSSPDGATPPPPTPPVGPPPPPPPVGPPAPPPMLGSCAVFPADNPWNTDISGYPVHPQSDAYVDSIGRDTGMHPDFGTVWEGAPIGIPYVLVSGDQPRVEVSFEYADESDPGPYPIPDDPPIEGGPDGDGDRHILMIDTD